MTDIFHNTNINMKKVVKDFDTSDNYTNYQVKVLRDKFTPEFKQQILNMHNDSTSDYDFNFMDGPPFVTGNLHWGHLTIGSIKSTILNYQRMKGKYCHNKMGYDTHGVPIESIVNSQLNIKSIHDLKQIGIEKFNQTCKENIIKFQGEWEPIYNKLGRWTNFQDTYKTMDWKFMESTWWAFNELYKKDLVYRSHKVCAYSTPLQSPLSNFETQQNYKTKNTKSIYVKFKLDDNIINNTYFLVWTTTPWTLPANCALCVNPTLDYGYYELETGDVFILQVGAIKNVEFKGKLIRTVKGQDLVGLKYIPPFNYYQDKLGENAFKICADTYVTTSLETETNNAIGTGIVHLAPAFGEDDYRVCIDKKIITYDLIQMCCPLTEDCMYTDIVSDFKGQFIFDAEPEIIKYLKSHNMLQKIQMYLHEYPYCYRTDTPLIYRTINAVYIKVSSIRDKLVEMNDKIIWYPRHVGDKRFKNWIENARDWCVSRSRYFGTPIPMWVSQDGDIKVIGSIQELEDYCGCKLNITDLHPEFIDKITFTIDNKEYKRIPDVLDCWFESGCVPYGQIHYPFENSNYFDKREYLSDFIVEGIDQTRGWFYTLLVLSTALMNKPAFKHVNVVGLVLDENGEKFSKKKKNYVDANIAIENDGADILRLYVMSSPLTQGETLKFKQTEVVELKQKIIQLINSVKFYAEHTINLGKKHQLNPNIHIINDLQKLESNFLDGWIYEVINNLAYDVDTWMMDYDISKSINALLDFIEDLTNYYIKLNRSALKGQNGVDEWQNSLGVLYNVLKTYLLILSSFAPFLTEYLFDHIKLIDCNNLDSIHLYSYPDTTNQLLFVPKFNMLKRILKIVRAERHKTQTHMSQKTPIASCKIRMNSQERLEEIKKFIHLISGELNCMELTYGEYDSELEYTIELNHRELGKKYRNIANDIKEKLMNLTQEQYSNALVNKNIDIFINNITYVVTEEMFTIKKIPKKGSNIIIDNDLMIQLDFTYNDIIKFRHIINCFVTHFQNHRKRVGLRPWNKVDLLIKSDEDNIVKPQQEVFESRTNVPVIYKYEEEKYMSTYTETYTHNLDNKDINIHYSLCVYKDN